MVFLLLRVSGWASMDDFQGPRQAAHVSESSFVDSARFHAQSRVRIHNPLIPVWDVLEHGAFG